MDGPPNSNVPHQQQHSNLIRTDQVIKLPHLSDQQKLQHTQLVRNLWEMLNTRDPSTPDYQNAHMKLNHLSQNLMKGMRAFQQSRQQQAVQHQQAQAAQAAGQPQPQAQPPQRTQSANPQSFGQLLPQIQSKVNALHFCLPPNINRDQVQTWLPEARLRYGIALQKQEVGRARINEMRQNMNQRQNMSQEDMQELKARQLAAEKLYREGSDFLNKFREQQETFKQQQQLNRTGSQNAAGQNQQAPTNPEQAAGVTSENRINAPMHPGQPPAPAAHTVNSAVSAARTQGQSMSPSTSQTGQPPQAPATSAPQQPTQLAFNQTSTDGAAPAPTTQPINPQGPPRALTHQAAISQAAQSYSQNNATNQNNDAHAHPTGYAPNRQDSSSRDIKMPIPKNLNVPPPEPVTMASSRPSLSGGPSHATMGMMGQPAIQKHPGYVLEGDGQRVLSKKMLDSLVRQVTGGGEGEGLTPDAEEVPPSPSQNTPLPPKQTKLTKTTVHPPNGRRLRRRRNNSSLSPLKTTLSILHTGNPRPAARPRAQLQHAHLRLRGGRPAHCEKTAAGAGLDTEDVGCAGCEGYAGEVGVNSLPLPPPSFSQYACFLVF